MNLTELAKELDVSWSMLKLRFQALGFSELGEKEIAILKSHFRKGEGEPGTYNNGVITVKVKKGFLPPEGFVKGSLYKPEPKTGLFWITNGTIDKMVSEIPEGFRKGRSKGEQKREATNLERYGAISNLLVADQKQLQQKRQSTNLERYGGVSPTCSEAVKEKVSETWSQKTKEEIKEIQTKILEHTDLEKKNAAIKSAWENMSQEKKDEIQAKREKTNLEKYGVPNQFLKESSKAKAREAQKTESYKQKHSESTKRFNASLTKEQRQQMRKKASSHNYKASDGECFDSLWELKYYEYCKEHNFNVKREPVELAYMFEGKEHHCYPDFEVNGELIEVKGDHFLRDGKMINPFEAQMNGLYEAKRQCMLQNGVRFLFKEDLKNLGIIL